jgi:hypothetical protein
MNTRYMATLLVFSLVSVSGCFGFDEREGPSFGDDDDDDTDGDDDDDLHPEIMVVPTDLDFGTASGTDAETVKETLTIHNVGEDYLHVTEIEIKKGAESFNIPDLGHEFVLYPDDSVEYTVEFTPSTPGENTGKIVVYSSDPDNGETKVNLTGQGNWPSIDISPSSVNFGSVSLGCDKESTISIANDGDEKMFLTDISDNVSEVTTSGLFTPATINTNNSKDLTLTFAPTALGAVSGTLTIQSNAWEGTQSTSLSGTGIHGSTETDSFVAEAGVSSADIIFAVDQSGSMDQRNKFLGSAFPDFITALEAITTDWHVGVVTNDTGCFDNSGILDSTVYDYANLFYTAVLNGGCSGGSPDCLTEALLQLSDQALAETTTYGCNTGFLRPGGALHIIVISDEKDQSASTAATYLASYENYVSDPDLLTVSAIVDSNTYCGDGTGPGEYSTAVTSTSGVELDICTSWYNDMATLAQATKVTGATTSSFELSKTPDPTSIEVEVNYTTWTTGWQYDSTYNKVSFDTDLNEGDIVDITYGTWGCP